MDNKRHLAFSSPARWLLACIIVLMVIMSAPASSDGGKTTAVYIITSPGSDYQARVANTIISKLATDSISVSSIEVGSIGSLTTEANTVFITFGNSTSDEVRQLHPDHAQLNIVYNDNAIGPNHHNRSVLLLSQPVCRQVLFIRKLDPEWDSAGIITSARSSNIAKAIRQCASQYGLTLREYRIDEEKDLLHNLNMAVDQNDILIAQADVDVYNNRSVKNVLLTAYRHRKPVIGYSKSFVEAGAIAAIFTSAEDAGEQAANIILDYISAQDCFRRPVYTPSSFTVSINRQVARALDIDLNEAVDYSEDIDLLEIH